MIRVLPVLILLACSPELGEGSHDPSHPRMLGMADAHNAVRAEASPTPEPPLAPLVWSDELAQGAAAWAQRCIQAHDPDVGSLGQGENWRSWSLAGDLTADRVVLESGWALEGDDYDYDSHTCAGGDATACGHYTQIVWRETTEVGCAFQECPSGMREWREGREIWFCRYSPAGNLIGERPY